jgi:hypothetical protein
MVEPLELCVVAVDGLVQTPPALEVVRGNLPRPVTEFVGDVGGLREIIVDNVTGLLVPAGDATTLANAIIDVITNPAGATVRADAARTRVAEHYTWPVVAKSTVTVYQHTQRTPGRRLRPPVIPDMNVFTHEEVTR